MLIVLLLLCVFINLSASVPPSSVGYIFNDALRNPSSKSFLAEDARRHGYPVEERTVKTKDGYILKLFRMPSSPNSSCKMALPVYIFHGLTESSDYFLMSGPKRALAYVLADSGYDVWLGNARGNTFSRNHERLFANSSKFWQFSYHEIALYDNPSMIDYILEVTNQKQLHYIGHSQGTTTFFILTSLRPEYNDKVKTMHALAPVTFFKHQISPFFTFATNNTEKFMKLSNNYGFTELLPNYWITRLLAKALCTPPDRKICYEILRLIGGQSPLQEVDNLFPRVFSIFPAGCSTLQLIHYTQTIRNGGFKFFDYGKKENMKRYGGPTPPDYPLQNVVASPIFLYVSGGDYISQPPDVHRLMARLPKKPIYIEIEDKHFGHFDYAFGKYAKELVYDRILREMVTADGEGCHLKKLR